MAPPATSAAVKTLLRLLEISERVCQESKFASDAEKEKMQMWSGLLRGVLSEKTLNATSAKALQGSILTMWNEGVGPATEAFWKQIEEARLPITRTRDVVSETLARGRIKDVDEYGRLAPNFELLQTSGKIDATQARALLEMIYAFADFAQKQAVLRRPRRRDLR